ncbi:histidine kinase [uncultured Roseivirga sp.]|uniref:sensor histidine kinase n=1 Tax=uncultured Roseivirga sp. TaxID=543088 RepID=UPI000D7A26F1|nr:histidine kinase [uncultured Roseivirga sp.]PWL30695.1 MAG: hypothetical protein DCO95_04245 [Roseivirga sp. XM-24bin3]
MKSIKLARIMVLGIFILLILKNSFLSFGFNNELEIFFKNAFKVLEDTTLVAKYWELKPAFEFIHYFIILISGLLFFLTLRRLKRIPRLVKIFLLLNISVGLGYLSTHLDFFINPYFYLYFPQPAKIENLTLFNHAFLRNTVEYIGMTLVVVGLERIESILFREKHHLQILKRIPTGAFSLIILTCFFLLMVTFSLVYKSASFGIIDFINLAISQILFITPFLTFISVIALIYLLQKKSIIEAYFNVAEIHFCFVSLFLVFYLFPKIAFGDTFLNDISDPALFIFVALSFLPPLLGKLANKAFKEGIELRNLQFSTASELSNLKSQINPHFLFNSLNSLYGLALEESSPKTSTGIQKLSEMMRFMLRENVEDKIEISREFEYVENYIELQKLRVDGNEKVRLEYEIDKACEGKITPMLIIPFIENAFKHGVSAHHNSWIEIKLNCSKEAIHLNVKNSNHKKSKSTEEESGIGLENVRQRLTMLYPGKHLFQLFENEESFEANLKIELN